MSFTVCFFIDKKKNNVRVVENDLIIILVIDSYNSEKVPNLQAN